MLVEFEQEVSGEIPTYWARPHQATVNGEEVLNPLDHNILWLTFHDQHLPILVHKENGPVKGKVRLTIDLEVPDLAEKLTELQPTRN